MTTRRRPHPARRARRVVGATSALGMLVLTGALASHELTGTTVATTATAQLTAAGVGSTASTTSTTVAAVAARPSRSADTTSHGS